MVLGVLSQAFDVLVLRYGVQKRVYCNVSMRGSQAGVKGLRGRWRPATRCRWGPLSPPPAWTDSHLAPALTCVFPFPLLGFPYSSSIWWGHGPGIALVDTQAWRVGSQAKDPSVPVHTGESKLCAGTALPLAQGGLC